MSVTDVFIRRPVLALACNAIILLLGLIALLALPIRQYPALEAATISISTHYPGATPEVMQGYVTTPIAQAVSTVTGVEYLRSQSVQGRSTVDVRLKLNADSDVAMTDIMAKVSEVSYRIPSEATDPVISRATGEPTAIMYVGFSSDTMSVPQITDYIDRAILPRMAAFEGIGNLFLGGSQPLAMRLWLDSQRMAAYGITAADVAQALRANNVQAAPGRTESDWVAAEINVQTDVESVAEFRELVVRADGDRLVRLSDIATVELGAKSRDHSGRMDGREAVYIAVEATPTGNPLTIVNTVRAFLAEAEKDFPPGLEVRVPFDVAKFVDAALDEVLATLLEATLIVVAVMYLFLGSFRSVLIPIVTIPLSLIGAAAIMWAAGFSLNLLTLLAMVLAIGLVVDDAIVVVENVFRHLERGESATVAAVKGAREIVGPVIAMTLTLAAVYTPIGLLGGLTGSLFREFAFTLAATVLVSGVVALTLSPVMASLLISRETVQGRFAHRVELLFEALVRGYRRLLSLALAWRGAVLVLALAIVAAIAAMYTAIPSELAPEDDQGTLFTVVEAPQQANIHYTEHYTDRMEPIFRELPEYGNTFMINGAGGANQAFGGITLLPWDQRQRSVAELQPILQQRLASIDGVSIFVFPLPALPGSTGGMPVQLVISSPGPVEKVVAAAEQLKASARDSGLFAVVDSDVSIDKPLTRVRVDRAKASSLGIRMQDISDTLGILLNENYVNRFNIQGRSYEVIPQLQRGERLGPDNLQRYYLRAAGRQLVPLNTVIAVERGVDVNQLSQFNQLNSVLVQAIPMPGVTLGEAVAYLGDTARAQMPVGFAFDWQGESRQYVAEGGRLGWAFVFALLVIYLVLAAQFDSLRDPLVILVSVPMSIFGALLPLYLGYSTLNIYTQIGLVTLIGLISKHGILMVEFANQLQRQQGLNRVDAIAEAAAVRLRPILMTTGAMVVGLFPLIHASGAGAGSRFALGIVIVVGMLVGTLFTLFVLPPIYTWLAADHQRHAASERERELKALMGEGQSEV